MLRILGPIVIPIHHNLFTCRLAGRRKRLLALQLDVQLKLTKIVPSQQGPRLIKRIIILEELVRRRVMTVGLMWPHLIQLQQVLAEQVRSC